MSNLKKTDWGINVVGPQGIEAVNDIAFGVDDDGKAAFKLGEKIVNEDTLGSGGGSYTAGHGIIIEGNKIKTDVDVVADVDYVDASITSTMLYIDQQDRSEHAGRVAGDNLLRAAIETKQDKLPDDGNKNDILYMGAGKPTTGTEITTGPLSKLYFNTEAMLNFDYSQLSWTGTEDERYYTILNGQQNGILIQDLTLLHENLYGVADGPTYTSFMLIINKSDTEVREGPISFPAHKVTMFDQRTAEVTPLENGVYEIPQIAIDMISEVTEVGENNNLLTPVFSMNNEFLTESAPKWTKTKTINGESILGDGDIEIIPEYTEADADKVLTVVSESVLPEGSRVLKSPMEFPNEDKLQLYAGKQIMYVKPDEEDPLWQIIIRSPEQVGFEDVYGISLVFDDIEYDCTNKSISIQGQVFEKDKWYITGSMEEAETLPDLLYDSNVIAEDTIAHEPVDISMFDFLFVKSEVRTSLEWKDGGSGLPEYTEEDTNKVLTVVPHKQEVKVGAQLKLRETYSKPELEAFVGIDGNKGISWDPASEPYIWVAGVVVSDIENRASVSVQPSSYAVPQYAYAFAEDGVVETDGWYLYSEYGDPVKTTAPTITIPEEILLVNMSSLNEIQFLFEGDNSVEWKKPFDPKYTEEDNGKVLTITPKFEIGKSYKPKFLIDNLPKNVEELSVKEARFNSATFGPAPWIQFIDYDDGDYMIILHPNTNPPDDNEVYICALTAGIDIEGFVLDQYKWYHTY